MNRAGNCIRWAGWRESAVGVRSKVGSWLGPRWELQMAGGRSGGGERRGVGSKVGSWSRTGNCTGLDGGEREASWFSGVSFHPSHHL